MMVNVSEVLWRDRECNLLCTYLAVEGTSVGDIFLDLVGIHWLNLVAIFGCRG